MEENHDHRKTSSHDRRQPQPCSCGIPGCNSVLCAGQPVFRRAGGIGGEPIHADRCRTCHGSGLGAMWAVCVFGSRQLSSPAIVAPGVDRHRQCVHLARYCCFPSIARSLGLHSNSRAAPASGSGFIRSRTGHWRVIPGRHHRELAEPAKGA